MNTKFLDVTFEHISRQKKIYIVQIQTSTLWCSDKNHSVVQKEKNIPSNCIMRDGRKMTSEAAWGQNKSSGIVFSPCRAEKQKPLNTVGRRHSSSPFFLPQPSPSPPVRLKFAPNNTRGYE